MSRTFKVVFETEVFVSAVDVEQAERKAFIQISQWPEAYTGNRKVSIVEELYPS